MRQSRMTWPLSRRQSPSEANCWSWALRHGSRKAMTVRAKRMLTIISNGAFESVRRGGDADAGPLVGTERVFVAIEPERLLPLHDDSPSLICTLLLPAR